MRSESVFVAPEKPLPQAPRQPALEVRNIVKTYGKVRALEGVNFSVEPGSIFALLGPNGAGKSTTVKILNTLSFPDSGHAFVMGIDVLRYPDKIRRLVGWVGQKSGVDTSDTARENLTLQGQIYGMKGRALTQRVDTLLDQVGLAPVANRPARTYSGGTLRRLDIALGLVHHPKVLFLDEPTSGLDPESRVAIWAELSRLAEQEAVTVFLTTHYLEEADRLANKLVIMDKGRIIVEGTPEALKGELFGDALQIDLQQNESANSVRGALATLDCIREIIVEPRTVRARANRAATAIPVVLAALEVHGVRVASVTMARPSLDDVYMRYTGRRFYAGDRGGME